VLQVKMAWSRNAIQT